MSDLRDYFEQIDQHFTMPLARFMLVYGQDYRIGPDTFAGKRMERNNCFQNATHLALSEPTLTYVEGKLSCHGVPLDHAWCVDASGQVIDPTIDGYDGHIHGYYGVPFEIRYVRKAVRLNNCYGLLDGFHARKTLPKLIELGLHAGQDWLLRQSNTTLRRKLRRKEGANQ